MAKLQPYHLFVSETTAVNELYWLSRYSFRRVTALVGAMAKLGHPAPDPRVDEVWPSIEDGERRHISFRISAFTNRLDGCEERVRATSLVYLCSAFENALAGYFILACLYRPSTVIVGWSHGALPSLLRTPLRTKAVVQAAADKAYEKLKGPYGKRVKFILRAFSLPIAAVPVPAALDTYYTQRHLMAHDQGLATSDDPCVSAIEAGTNRVSISENAWKVMIKDFLKVVTDLDSELQRAVVKDKGLCLGVRRILERDGPLTIGSLHHRVMSEWRIRPTHTDVEKAAIDVGATVGNGNRINRRTVEI